jgi:hypothetical protein
MAATGLIIDVVTSHRWWRAGVVVEVILKLYKYHIDNRFAWCLRGVHGHTVSRPEVRWT